MIVIVCGSRHYQKKDSLFAAMDRFHAERPISMLVEGGKRKRDHDGRIIGGADYWAAMWAKKNKIKHKVCYAQWRKFGNAAGPLRNVEMIARYKPEVVIAFPGGRGTENMIQQARLSKIPVVRMA